MGKVVSVSPFPTSSSLPVSIPISLPHQLIVPRLGTMASGLKVNSPGGISSSCQQVGAAAQEVVVMPIKSAIVKKKKSAIVEARPGGTGGQGMLVLYPELGHSPCQGL